MADLAFISVVIAFFGLSGAFVVLCDRIVGPADDAVTQPAPVPGVEVPTAEAA